MTDDGPGFRLIRGAAGSGKTTAALLRLKQLCASRLARRDRLGLDEPVRVLVLTFNRTLRGYVEHLARTQVPDSNDLQLTVETFARWAVSLVGRKSITSGQGVIRRLLRGAGIPEANLEYFVGEIEYILGRFRSDEREKYVTAERSGRGRAPAVPRDLRGKLLCDVIAPYEDRKSTHGTLDWNDLALEAGRAASDGYDIVVVDESQDLSANQIRTVLSHLKRDHVTTFIIDAVQRIYPQSFRWQELGIGMRPHMVFVLSRNHRNTREIARFAASLVQGLPPEEDGAAPDARACRESGRRPAVLVGPYGAQLKRMLDRVRPFLDAGETVAILQPRGGGWFDAARRALRQRGIPFCELTREADWPTGKESVALSTIHSAKGLEFDHVLLPGLNREVTPHGEDEGDGTLDSLRRLVAMGVGRARRTVAIGHHPGERSALIDLIDPATYDRTEL